MSIALVHLDPDSIQVKCEEDGVVAGAFVAGYDQNDTVTSSGMSSFNKDSIRIKVADGA